MAHDHDVWDDDPLFVIDPDSRTITKQSSSGKTQLMQYDHNSEVFRFEIPLMIESHHVNQCDIKQIHYINTGTGTSVSNRESNVGIYEIQDMELIDDIDGPRLRFDWLVSQNATQLVGDVKFQIKFGCTNPDEPGVVDYMWGSQVYSAVEILPGINNTEIVAIEYVDILQQWREEIEREIAKSGGGSGGSLEGYVKSTDYATLDNAGVVKAATSGNTYGIVRDANGIIQIACATETDIAQKTNQNKPITPNNLEYAVEVCTLQTEDDVDTISASRLPVSGELVSVVYDNVIEEMDERIGSIDTALDNIIAIQNSLIGGDSE